LNGIDHVARLREVYAHVTAGALGGETERIEPGHIVQPSGFLWIHLTGEHALDACHDLGSICSVKEDERLVLWQKLAILAPFALSTTAVQQPLGAIRGDPAQWARLLAAIDEVTAVAHAQGIPVVADAAKNGLANAGPEFRSSMQKDRAAGRPLELDHIVEPILREGRRHGVPTPVVEGLAGQIRALAQG
jgi:2-dehydropantoate 2-reductase